MRSTNRTISTFAAMVAIGLLVGCGTSNDSSSAGVPSAEGASYRLGAEPPGAKGVKEVRADAKDDEEITVVGRIGGDTNPWIEGQAAFLVVDTALKPCNERDDDACETPWDYCCDTDALPANKVMVKVVDESGKPLAVDARKLLGIKELQTVVVHGRAHRDQTGNLVVLADGIFVRSE
jgi:hypothetical protein